MAEDIKEAETSDLMAEAKSLHDLIYNVGASTKENKERLEALYAEIQLRGYSVVEQYDVNFVESVISTN
jgi:hypothetical protein